MSTLRDLEKEVRPPPKTLILEPHVFADTWSGKPNSAVCVGLRLISDGEKQTARGEAERIADELHQKRDGNWSDAFNDALVRYLVAFAMCSPNDVAKPSEVLPHAEIQVREAFTSLGARFVFDAYLALEVELSPLYPEATEEDIEELAEAFSEVNLHALPGVQRSAILRHLRFALDAINETREALHQ